MKVIRQKLNKQGKLIVTVEVDAEETLMAFKDDGFYRIGGQVDEVLAGHVLIEATSVVWCSATQTWV